MPMTADELADCKRYRGTLKGTLTRLSKFIKNIKPEVTLEEITVRLNSIQNLLKEFSDIDQKISAYADQVSEIDDFETNYFAISATLTRLIKEKRIRQPPSTDLNETFARFTDQQNSFLESIQNRTQELPEKIRLPKVNIPPFSGNYSDFPSFRDLFENAIHNNQSLSNVIKFQYLKGFLRDSALNVIKDIKLTESNYEEAWKKLVHRFNVKKGVIHEHLERFLDQPSVTNSSNLRQLYDNSDRILRGLKALGPEAESRDPWLIHTLLKKLDKETNLDWAKESRKIDFPTIYQFLEFIHDRCVMFETSLNQKHQFSRNTTQTKVHNVEISSGTSKATCKCCEGDHRVYQCEKFLSMSPNERRSFVTTKGMCFNCLYSGHSVTSCTSRRSCFHCKRKHHSLLHGSQMQVNTQQISETPVQVEQEPTTSSQVTAGTCAIKMRQISYILPTAMVKVADNFGRYQLCRALLDSGSQATLISTSCLNKLHLKRTNGRITITGIASSTTSKGSVTLKIIPYFKSEETLTVEALILDKLSQPTMGKAYSNEYLASFEKLQLADPEFHHQSEIDILLGAGPFFEIIQHGQIKSKQGNLTAINTSFGWIISGSTNNNSTMSTLKVEIDIDRSLRRFWEIEEEFKPRPILTDEENACENHFIATHQRSDEGRFIVKLPFKNDCDTFGISLNQAISRFNSLERKFNINPLLKQQYVEFMEEYRQLGHMIECPSNQISFNSPHFYLPHHAVFKESNQSSKIRVVFDGSAKDSNGISLNDRLMVGPTIQDDLVSILLRFRKYPFAFTADIEKMYRQISLNHEDQEFQRILWRKNPTENLKTFKLATVTYGTSSASFLAIRALHQLAEVHKITHPRASIITKNDFYVDDCLTGAMKKQECVEIKTELQNMLKLGGFKLCKWHSNIDEL